MHFLAQESNSATGHVNVMGKLSPSGKELLALRLLRDSPAGMYGLEMVNASDGKLKRGAIYTTLAGLQEKGFIESRTNPKARHEGIPRPIYQLTALGQRALVATEMMGFEVAGVHG